MFVRGRGGLGELAGAEIVQGRMLPSVNRMGKDKTPSADELLLLQASDAEPK